MSYIKAGQDVNGEEIKLHYTDQGQGAVVVLIHGWPQSHEAWSYQLGELPKHGLRVVAYEDGFEAVPTRFQLPPQQVDDVIAAGRETLRISPIFQAFSRGL